MHAWLFRSDCLSHAVKVDGVQQSVGNFSAGPVTGAEHHYLPFYGQAVNVVTPALTYFVHAVQPQVSPAGLARGHADIQVTLTKPVLDLHGLLGQSHGPGSRSCSPDYTFNGEGIESEYIMSTLMEVTYKYGKFGQNTNRSRKVLELHASTMPPMTASIMTA